MGSTQIVPSFPVSVWDGVTPSRPSALSDRKPDAADFNRVVAELQATQQWLRDYIGAKYSKSAITNGPGNYTSTINFGDAVDLGAPDGNPSTMILAVGALNGDTNFSSKIQESTTSTGPWYDIPNAISALFDTENTICTVSFINQKRYVRGVILIGGSEHDLNAVGLVLKGSPITTGGISVFPANYTADQNGDAIDFGVILDNKMINAIFVLGNVAGVSSCEFLVDESTDATDWFNVGTFNTFVGDASTLEETSTLIFTKAYQRTRRYMRVRLNLSGSDHFLDAAALLTR